MDEGLAGLGFWLFLAIIIAAGAWEKTRKRQMKNDVLLRMIESGQPIDDDILEKISPSRHKFQHDGGSAAGGVGFLFVLLGFGLVIAGVGVGFAPDQEMSYPFFGIGAFSFLYGNYIWSKAKKVNKGDKHSEDLDSD